MIVSSEKFHPNPESLKTIRAIGESMLPYIGANQWAQKYIAGNSLRIAHDYDLLQEFLPRNGTIVDIGAIPPLLLSALKRGGHDAIGLDADPERFRDYIDKYGLTIKRVNVETQALPLQDNSVDLIIFNEIFEHMRIDLIAVFRELHRVLKPGGQILMSTPNGLALHAIAVMIRRRQQGPSIYFEYEKLTRVGHMGHVREYAVNDVLQFLSEMNFEVPQIIYRGRYHHRYVDAVLRLFKSLRPFVSFVIRKPL